MEYTLNGLDWKWIENFLGPILDLEELVERYKISLVIFFLRPFNDLSTDSNMYLENLIYILSHALFDIFCACIMCYWQNNISINLLKHDKHIEVKYNNNVTENIA